MESVAAFETGLSASRLPGTPTSKEIHIVFIVLLEVKLLFWMLWAVLQMLFVLDIADVALIKSLSKKTVL